MSEGGDFAARSQRNSAELKTAPTSPHVRYQGSPVYQQQSHACNSSDGLTTGAKSDSALNTNWNGATLTHATAPNLYSEPLYAPGDPLPAPRPGAKSPISPWNYATPPSEPDSVDDEYNWSTDEDLVKEIDARYEEELTGVGKAKKSKKRWSWSTLALWPVVKALATTFLGNMVVEASLVVGGLLVRFLYRNKHDGDSHSQYISDNAEAWLYWFAFNIGVSWALHFLVELLPRLLLNSVMLVWGNVSERVKTALEFFQTAKKWFKPILYAACAWASWAVVFTTIFKLRSGSDPEHSSRAGYTYRVYQAIEVIFFAVLIFCIEKFFILVISLRFHSVAYAERIKDNNRALSILDRLKDYRPRRRHVARPSRPGLSRGISNDGVGGKGWHTPGGMLTPSLGLGTGLTSRPRSVFRDSPEVTDTEGEGDGTGRKGRKKIPFAGLGNWGQEKTKDRDRSTTTATPGPFGSTASSPSNSRQNTGTFPVHDLGDRPPMRPSPASAPAVNHFPSGSSPLHPHSDSPIEAPHFYERGHARNITIADTPAPGRSPEASGQVTPRPGMSRSSTRDSLSNAPAAIAKLIAKKKVSAAEIARQAIKDPLATLGKGKGGLGLDITSPKEAKKLARSLFWAFRSDPNRAYLVANDFYPAFKSVADAKDAFRLFDTDGNGDITRTEIKSRVLQTYKERRFLARSLQDVGHVVGKLDQCFLVVGAIVFLFVCLAVFSVDIGKTLTTFYSLGIAAAFIFKNFCTNLFDSVVFLFVTHAYDTGDRIFLDEEVLVVKQIQLLATTFTKWDGTDMWIPNFKLAQKFIINLRRSGYQFENATLQVGWDTSLESLDQLENLMNKWLQSDEKRMFEPSTAVVIQKMEYCQYMEITVGMVHRANWQDWGARWDRRTAFHLALAHYTNQLGITCFNSLQPVAFNPRELDELPDVLSGDDEDDFAASPLSPLPPGGGNDLLSPGGTTAPVAHAGDPKKSYLGFVPPEGTSGRIRKRKLQSRKKALRGEGAG